LAKVYKSIRCKCFISATENAGVEIAEVDHTGGKCRSGKCKSR